MDFISPILDIITKYLIDPLIPQVGYLIHLKDNVEALIDVTGKLTGRREDERSALEAAEREGKLPTGMVSDWLKAVDEIKTKADAIEEEYRQGMTCLKGLCTNCWSRYKLSKRATMLKLVVDDRLAAQFVLAKPPPPESVRVLETTPIEDQPSVQGTLQKILDAINDQHYGVIGVYGMGGVGKTTLLENVNNHFKEQPSFDTVIMVTVSATPNILNIQKKIGQYLGLDLSSCNEEDAKDKLLAALRRKKHVLILDDLWHELKLEDIGIPRPKIESGCKILVSSRNQDVCTDTGAKITIEVNKLSDAEAWRLFIKTAGEHVTSPLIKPHAEIVLRKAEGLPLAITTIAHAMANRHTVGEWEDAVRELNQSAASLRGMKEKVFDSLKFSYDRLESDTHKSLFLFCALYPEDYSIKQNELAIHCIGEGFVDRLGTLRATRNKVATLVGSLKTACMLKNGEEEGEGEVRMHDMMRELALWITSPETEDGPKFLVQAQASLKVAPEATDWEEADRISLSNNELEALPELSQASPKLTTLLLNNNNTITVIPSSGFFEYMEGLRVLDLTWTQIRSLSPSLSYLVNLRVLILRNSYYLEELPPIGGLQQLQYLDLFNCWTVQKMPEGMGDLINLRYLNLRQTSFKIPGGMFSRLLKLEELDVLGAVGIKWRVDDDDGDDDDEGDGRGIIHNVWDLTQLNHLSRLVIRLNNIIISDWIKPLARSMEILSLESCKFENVDALIALDGSQCLSQLDMFRCKGVTRVPTCISNILEVNHCEELESLVVGEEAKDDSFQCLRELRLWGLPKLEAICIGIPPPYCFVNLRRISISECNILKVVFTKGIAQRFNNLEEFKVLDCKGLEEVIEVDGPSSSSPLLLTLPRLRDLWLNNLPQLSNICSKSVLFCPLIKHLEVEECPHLDKEPLGVCNELGALVIKKKRWEGEVVERES
ncbi:disease resistance protein RPS2 [Amborella trichopoda]|uniref:Uncharacterized protein n=1 Tax=Amborella trichopoda TaxID=13333 RepID=W1NUI7_AMBTC|nr:disease resistance protein RPS2 [Amborella trichopoda]ERM99247.1 hypothetical protein AMTR_s00092p00137320 [Amborella trichopoda]|eukprot:XP_006836394.1 disease resistance protein RPS2 [Amborella trichopoda]